MTDVLNIIWVGGTSALARTYVDEIGARPQFQQFRVRFIMVGHEPPVSVAEGDLTSVGGPVDLAGQRADAICPAAALPRPSRARRERAAAARGGAHATALARRRRLGALQI